MREALRRLKPNPATPNASKASVVPFSFEIDGNVVAVELGEIAFCDLTQPCGYAPNGSTMYR